ncbi:MAG: response regulator [Chitinispirillaceae bacterium]|nr:response regulator [Chitinispirillaceae bacterium]
MSKHENGSPYDGLLRKRAEEWLKSQGKEAEEHKADLKTRRLYHELQVHQIELKMQNEELNRAKADLEAGLTRYTDLYDFSPVAYVTLDRDGIIRELNLTCSKLFGMERSRLKDRHFGQFIIDADRPGFKNMLTKAFSSRVHESFETQLAATDTAGAFIHLETIVAEDGAECRAALVDITERLKIEQELNNTQRLLSLGILAGGIAHDFNNLLSGMFGHIDLAVEDLTGNDPASARGNLAKAGYAYDRAKALTRQLLTFSKEGEPVCKPVAIEVLVRDSSHFALSGSNVICQVDGDDDLWSCCCDENQIAQVIENIVINARQAMPMGGTIAITLKNVTIAPGRPGKFHHTGDFVRISIEDCGIGIPRETLSRIFDPFFTTKSAGHGLGLATAYSIINRHQGWIDVESEPDEGTIFHIFLPSLPDVATVEPCRIAAATHRGSGRVLVMDDEECVREVLGKMLKKMGYTVVQTKNGDEALLLYGIAERSREPFALAILDLTITCGMGGRETCQKILKVNAGAVLIAASGYADDSVMVQPDRYGFTDRIIKPFRHGELAELLNRITGNCQNSAPSEK